MTVSCGDENDGLSRPADPTPGYSIMVGCERFEIVDEEVSNDPRIKTFRVTFWQGDKSILVKCSVVGQ